jgi:hypothetical protein
MRGGQFDRDLGARVQVDGVLKDGATSRPPRRHQPQRPRRHLPRPQQGREP